MALDPRAAAAEAAEQQRLVAERRAAEAALREVLRTAAGRTWVSWQLRELCGVFEPGYVPGERREERHTDYNEGRRFVGLETLKASGASLDLFRQFREDRGSHAAGRKEGPGAKGRAGRGQEAEGRSRGRSGRGRNEEKAQS